MCTCLPADVHRWTNSYQNTRARGLAKQLFALFSIVTSPIVLELSVHCHRAGSAPSIAVVSKGSIVFELSFRYLLTITPTAFRIAGFNIKACNPTLSWTVSPEAADESVGWEQLPILPSH